jgi:hypothetical protein
MIKLHVAKEFPSLGIDRGRGNEMAAFRCLATLVVTLLSLSNVFADDSIKTGKGLGQRVAAQRSGIAQSLRISGKKMSSSASSTSILSHSVAQSVFGFLEFRPSYTSVVGEFHSENTAEVGYKLNPSMKLGYVQYYSTNLMSNIASTQGLNLIVNDGFAYFKAKDVWQSKDQKWSASYQLRLLTPTDANKSQAGFITSLRNQFKISYKYNDFVSTDFTYIPILHGYSKTGLIDSKGVSRANPTFDHQLVLNHDFHPASNITISLPLIYQVTSYNQFAGAANSGRFKKTIIFLPEIDYDINPMHTVGFAYYTDNCISAYESGLSLSNGFKNGVFQLVWGINL